MITTKFTKKNVQKVNTDSNIFSLNCLFTLNVHFRLLQKMDNQTPHKPTIHFGSTYNLGISPNNEVPGMLVYLILELLTT